MPELTDVEFQFYKPDGTPLADTVFSITLKRSGFITEAVGVVVPDVITATTDAEGKVVIKLHPSSTPYFLQLPADAVVDEDCCSNALARYKFYVPEVAPGVIVRAQDLFIAVAPSNVPYDEEAILIITEAKLTSVNAAREALASAIRAETAAVSIEGDADRAEAARDAAEASKNAAAGSAQASANSANAAGQSAADALASKNAAANSANAANNSAVSASNDAGRAATSATAASASKDAAAASATAASGSATTATNAANSATASKDAAAASATTASTKAGEASTSAGNALTQANRAKTEADRAVAATDGKQDKHVRLTALSNLNGTANKYSVPAFYAQTANCVPVLVATDARETTVGALTQVGHAGWGATNPIPLTAQSSVVNINQQAVFVASGLTDVGLPSGTGDFFLDNYSNGGGWITQVAREVTGPRSFERWRHGGNGNWSEWSELFTTTAKIDASSGVKLRLRNYLGIGTPQTYATSIDAMTPAQGVVLGAAYVTNTTVGTKPGGYTYGILETMINDNDHAQQEFTGLTAQAGVTNNKYRRTGYGTTWGPWRLVIDEVSATLAVENGGVVSQTTAGVATQTKFASGLVITHGAIGSTSVIPINSFTTVDLTVPFNTGVNTELTVVCPVASPFVTNDWYGISNAYMSTPTNCKLVLRNGAGAEQAFGVRIAIFGRWK